MNKEEARSVIFGAISMALTDPVLQQAFENICNENKELKTVKIPQLERRIASIRGAHSVDCKKLNARTEQVERQKKRIAGLEKENDRLSRKCECLTKNNESLINILNDVERLEKENSELKESNKSYEEIIDHSSTALMKEKLKNYKQLTKAEEGENQNKELQALHKEIVDIQNECVSKLQIEIKQLQEENERLKKDSEENQDLATIAYMQGASKYKAKLEEAKIIIQDLLSNSDEYARQRAMDWLKEE